MQRLEYIHNNPVVEEIVREPSDYLYTSARNYNGGKGLSEVELIGLISFQLTGCGINASYERLVGHASQTPRQSRCVGTRALDGWARVGRRRARVGKQPEGHF